MAEIAGAGLGAVSSGHPTNAVAPLAPCSVPEVNAPEVAHGQAWRRLVPHAAALGGLLAFTGVSYPYAVSHLDSAILSDGADWASFLWSYWQVPHALFNLDTPFSTDLIFHPVGLPLAFHTNTPIESLLIGALGGIRGHGMGAVGDAEAHRDDSIFLYYATRHRHPMVNGVVARLPERCLAKLLSIPVYRQVLALQHDTGMTDRATFTGEDLRRLRIGFVVYHRDRPMPEVPAHVEALGLPVVANDGTVTVWEVPQAAGPSGGEHV